MECIFDARTRLGAVSNTPLQAALNGHGHCIESLARLRVDIDPKDEKEQTPLHHVRHGTVAYHSCSFGR